MSVYVVCETSNATVASICCAQLGSPHTMGTTTVTIIPQTPSPPVPTRIPSTTCKWASSDSTHLSELETWLSCADQYVNSTTNSVCWWPVTTQSNVAHSVGPTKWLGLMMLVGAVFLRV